MLDFEREPSADPSPAQMRMYTRQITKFIINCQHQKHLNTQHPKQTSLDGINSTDTVASFPRKKNFARTVLNALSLVCGFMRM